LEGERESISWMTSVLLENQQRIQWKKIRMQIINLDKGREQYFLLEVER
jgi:hypothetical protein